MLKDSAFAAKVGLYVAPPKHAIVLSVGEKAQIQTLDPHAAGPADEARSVVHDDP